MAGRSLAAGAAHAPAPARREAARKPKASRHIAELDGIRAIAIASVLVAHALGVGAGLDALHALHGINSLDWAVVGHLWLGVDLFFVLSGFLITGILLEARTERRYYRNFYIRRALRILPVLIVFLTFVATVFHGQPAYFAMALLFCANFAVYLGVDTPPGAGPLWSLGVEEQFYLLWPTVVRRFLPSAVLVIAAALFVAVACVRLFFTNDPSHDILLTWVRCDGLALGALVAAWMHVSKPSRATAGKAISGAMVLAALLLGFETILGSAHVSHALRPTEADLVFGAGLVAACAWRGSAATAFLRSGVARFVAGTSYCAYVIHLAVYNAVDAWGWTASSSVIGSGFLRLLFAVPIVFAIAALSKRYLEDPFLSLKGRLAPRERSEPA